MTSRCDVRGWQDVTTGAAAEAVSKPAVQPFVGSFVGNRIVLNPKGLPPAPCIVECRSLGCRLALCLVLCRVLYQKAVHVLALPPDLDSRSFGLGFLPTKRPGHSPPQCHPHHDR